MAWSAMKLKIVDLININIEGIEFDLVQALLDSGVQTKIRNIRKDPPGYCPRTVTGVLVIGWHSWS